LRNSPSRSATARLSAIALATADRLPLRVPFVYFTVSFEPFTVSFEPFVVLSLQTNRRFVLSSVGTAPRGLPAAGGFTRQGGRPPLLFVLSLRFRERSNDFHN
jgi:hypothetical protein